MTRSLIGKFWALFAVATIVAAVLLTFVRLMLPYVSLYQQDIEQWLGQALGQPVQIGALEAEWHGLGPQLKLYDIAFLDRHSGGVRASLKQAGITVDIPASLFNAELRFGSLTVSGVSLSVVRHHDGSIAVAGLGTAAMDDAVTPDGSSVMLSWLFSQERLALVGSTIHWYDEALSQKDLQFVNVNLELRNDGERHQFDGSASLPNDLGRRFSFAVDLQGDIFIAGGWSGRAYLNGTGMQTSPLLNWLPLAGLRVDNGIAELRLWSEWQQSRLQRLDGELSVFGLNLSRKPQNDRPSGSAEFLDALSGRFSWQRQSHGWNLDVDRFMLGRWGEFWPRGDYHIEWSDGGLPGSDSDATDVAVAQPDAARLQLWADYVRVDDVVALLLLTDLPLGAVRENALALQPSGILRQLHLHWQSGDESQPANDSYIGRLAFDSEFIDLSIQPWKKLPGISGLSGHLIANDHQGHVALKSRDMRFEAQPLFRQALTIDSLAGDLQWYIDSDGWHWSGQGITLANADVQLGVDVDLLLPGKGISPYLDLVAGYVSQPNALINLGRYLPVGIMPQATVRWLEQALVNGTIPNGGLIFHGPLKRFPFDQTDGLFEVRLVIEGGILDYVQDWPRLEELEAELIFSGRQMAVNAVQGKILGAELESVRASIANMTAKPALLMVGGEVNGGTAEVLRFLDLSPLRQRFGKFIDGVEAGGRSQVQLDLQVPLAKERNVVVNGAVLLQDSELLLAGGAVDLTRLNGRLGFSSDGLSADNVQGRVMGLDAQFSVATAKAGNSANDSVVTTVSAHGNATIEEIRTIVDPPLFDRFSGRSDWQARVNVPGRQGAAASLLVSSDLRGLATNLPAPVSKPADQTTPLVVEMDFPVELDRALTIQAGDDLNVVLDLDGQLQMQRGEIRFADGAAHLPKQAGMRLAGIIPAFSFDEWLPLFESLGDDSDAMAGEGVNRIEATVDDITLYRRHFDHARITATLKDNAWLAEVDSKQARGTVQVPLNDVIPLVMDMDHLYLQSVDDKGVEKTDDPRELPPMRIQSNSFHLDDIDFGNLALTASRSPAGLHLTDLRMQSPLMDIKAHGDWLVANDEHFSSFAINSSSPNVGKVLSRFGYANTIKGGKGSFDINARWPGEPLSFALARLDGNMHMAINNGHLLEVDPGVGRVFGLLSLQALPRRLILDFRDVFNKGFAFDRITGDFDVKNGQAVTSNLVMKGPAARISVEGRVGLVERDYDQHVTVVPDVAATVPIVTALTQGAGVGAAVLLLKKLLEPEIDKAAMIQYKVTGPWDNPVIERLPDERQKSQAKKNNNNKK